ncbi:23S rRNA (adenine(2503)-C(2))-methyltransferase RlmN [Mesoaciditoga lauensis]|uniref:23S rRNA (adenine(2503)-C(2))-methyltransferase RlmN n=1 Tax=Mesoaciditoga lauensis TaxID=1495039 RepID=UPI00055ACB7F|nr:23S rRNA (adenine(2503)-C(2))-methyltransferase RlmN [Mesoaciditoga lauensis]
MENILDYDYKELQTKLEHERLERYRATQIFDWVYKKKATSFAVMTNLSKKLREELSRKFKLTFPELVTKVTSKDGTVKFLWKYEDGSTVESVLLRYPDRISACISSQVGCNLGCKFCATGRSGFVRNLTSGEILAQILGMERSEKERIGNVVFMGMGEPMLNYDEVMRAIRVMVDPKALKISQRRISISTAGVVDGIEKLANEPLDVVLSVSLHAPTDEKRSKIMPINQKYPLSVLMNAIKNYQAVKGKRVTFEYILFDGFNDSMEDAKKLIELVKDIKCNVNLIPYNDTQSEFKRTPPRKAKEFEEFLKSHGLEAVIRAEKGSDIDAACGQLRRRTL